MELKVKGASLGVYMKAIGFDTSPCRNGTEFRKKVSDSVACADETYAILSLRFHGR